MWRAWRKQWWNLRWLHTFMFLPSLPSCLHKQKQVLCNPECFIVPKSQVWVLDLSQNKGKESNWNLPSPGSCSLAVIHAALKTQVHFLSINVFNLTSLGENCLPVLGAVIILWFCLFVSQSHLHSDCCLLNALKALTQITSVLVVWHWGHSLFSKQGSSFGGWSTMDFR